MIQNTQKEPLVDQMKKPQIMVHKIVILGRDTLGKDRMKAQSGEEDRPGLSNTGITVENLSTKAVYAKNHKMLEGNVS